LPRRVHELGHQISRLEQRRHRRRVFHQRALGHLLRRLVHIHFYACVGRGWLGRQGWRRRNRGKQAVVHLVCLEGASRRELVLQS